MKKIMMLAFAGMLVSGAAFADGGKKCSKGKDCCKKESKKTAKSDAKKEVKENAEITKKA